MVSEMATSKFKQLRRSYGFDEVAIVLGDITFNPGLCQPDTFDTPFHSSYYDINGLLAQLAEQPR